MPENTMTADEADEIVVRPFADFLREQSSGSSHEELSEGLHDLIARVRDTGKKGVLIYTVNVQTLKGDTAILMVTDEIKLKLPEHDRKGSVFYADKQGNLTRNDPAQTKFESLREVPGVGTVDDMTGEIVREVTS